MPCQVRIHVQATRLFQGIPSQQQKRLRSWADHLQADPTGGDKVQQRLIPKVLKRLTYHNSLWRIELPDAWRAFYTIQKDATTCIILFVWIGNHKQYDRLMGYRTS